ncbi:hypothetical protein FQR65_LT19908 [Abscondita terminalis]|nr:hypothetical protein FQR65_LT19908 [Abscondita terminalis]
MASITVREGEPIEKALKRFQKVAAASKAEVRKREYHMSKTEKRIYKQKQNSKYKKEANYMAVTKEVRRPEILKEKFDRIDLIKQSRIISGKKSKSNFSSLPEGVQTSLRKKQEILSVIETGRETYSPESLREKGIDFSTMTRQKAKKQNEELISKFAKNRGVKSETISLEGLYEQIKQGDRKTMKMLSELDNGPAKSRAQKEKEQLRKEAKLAAKSKSTSKK